MKRYKLLKDLPTLKKGTILSEGEPIFGVKTLITKNNGVGPTFIGNELFEELFEEIQEEPTDSIHWKTEYGEEEYWAVNSYGSIVKRTWSDSYEDLNMYNLGFIYPTKKECKKARNRKLAEVKLRRTSTFKPDFYKGVYAYTVGYDCKHKRLYVTKLVDVIIGNPITYESLEDAKKSIKENEREWRIYFGIETLDD